MGLFATKEEKAKRHQEKREKLEKKVVDAVRAVYKSAGYQNSDIQQSCMQKRADARARYQAQPVPYSLLNNHLKDNETESEFDRQCQAAVMKAKDLTEVFDAKVKGYPCFNTEAYFGYYPDENSVNLIEKTFRVHDHQDDLYSMWVADDKKKVTNASDAVRFERFKKYLADSMKPMVVPEYGYKKRRNALSRDGYIDRTEPLAKPRQKWVEVSSFGTLYPYDMDLNEVSIFKAKNERAKLPKFVRNDLNDYKLDTVFGQRKKENWYGPNASYIPSNQEFCSSGAFEVSRARKNRDPSHSNVHRAYRRYSKFTGDRSKLNEKNNE